MDLASTASLVDSLVRYRLLDSAQVEEVTHALQTRYPDARALAGELIRREWLTPFQANQLLQGKGQNLLLGSYVLLERLGAGGMGEVFKARNWKLGRVVAIKLMRQERLGNPDAVRRFEREVRAAATLSHPNIVRAHDADLIAGTHLLVMEYIEGASDLNRLVKKNGPLPVLHACDCARQVALGLQHAHERGLVHRDIKPANLLLAADGATIKILDMGLARLDRPATDDSSTMTQEGTVMGTPDYLSPEQAQESHTVDIRSDLYSLGCTLYFLLTGRPPFPDGTFIDKLFRHRLDEPRAVEQLRPEVPPAVAGVVRRLMAKKPEDRYQTPAEAALALDEALRCRGQEVTPASEDPFTFSFAAPKSEPAKSTGSLLRRHVNDRRWLAFGVAGCSILAISLVVLLNLLWKTSAARKSQEKHSAVAANASTEANRFDAWLERVAAKGSH